MSKKRKRKKKSEKESYGTGVRTPERCTRIVLATHHARRALATYFACLDLINLTVQYRYATITQHYRVLAFFFFREGKIVHARHHSVHKAIGDKGGAREKSDKLW